MNYWGDLIGKIISFAKSHFAALNHFQGKKTPNFLHYFSFHNIKSFARDWIIPGNLRKENAIQPAAVAIQKSMKMHGFMSNRTDRFGADQVTQYG